MRVLLPLVLTGQMIAAAHPLAALGCGGLWSPGVDESSSRPSPLGTGNRAGSTYPRVLFDATIAGATLAREPGVGRPHVSSSIRGEDVAHPRNKRAAGVRGGQPTAARKVVEEFVRVRS